MSGFKNSGIWPLDSKVLLGVPRPESSYHNCRPLSAREVESLMEQRRMERRNDLGIMPTVAASSGLDTSSGLMLTGAEALSLAKKKFLLDKARHALKMRRETESALKEANQVARVSAERLRHEQKALAVRVRLYKAPNLMPRETHLRRREARERKTTIVEKVTELVVRTQMSGDTTFGPVFGSI